MMASSYFTLTTAGVVWAVAMALPGFLAAVITLVRLAWRLTGPAGRTEPPQGITPAIAGVVYAGKVLPEHIAATLIDLAARGKARIEPAMDDTDGWLLIRLDHATKGLHYYERELLTMVFADGDRATLAEAIGRPRAWDRVYTVMRGIWMAAHTQGLLVRARRTPGAFFAFAGLMLLPGLLLLLGRLPEQNWGALGALAGAAMLAGTAPLRRQQTFAGAAMYGRLARYRRHLLHLAPGDLHPPEPAYGVALGVRGAAGLGVGGESEEPARGEWGTADRFAGAWLIGTPRDSFGGAGDGGTGDGGAGGGDGGGDGGGEGGN